MPVLVGVGVVESRVSLQSLLKLLFIDCNHPAVHWRTGWSDLEKASKALGKPESLSRNFLVLSGKEAGFREHF